LAYNSLIMKKMSDLAGRPKGLVWLAAWSFLLFPVAGCSRESGQTPLSRLTDPAKKGGVILEIEGTVYTNADFDKYVRNTVGERSGPLTPPALSRLFDDFVDEKILLKGARGQGIVLAEEEKDGYFRKFVNAADGRSETAAPTRDEASILADKLLVEKYLFTLVKDIHVEDADIASYYAAHKSDFLRPEKFQVSQVLLSSEGKASEIRERLLGATEEQFRATARAESAGPEAVSGGVMGVFSAGQLPPEIEKFILPMGEGEISRVVESTFGYHIFRMDKKFEAGLTTQEEAAPSIRAKLLAERRERATAAHLEELKSKLDWQSHVENLPFAYEKVGA